MKSITKSLNKLDINSVQPTSKPNSVLTVKKVDKKEEPLFTSPFKPYPHQQKTIDFMRQREVDSLKSKDGCKGGIVALQMGLGKTFCSLTHIANNIKKENNMPALVICPLSAIFTWTSEIMKFYPSSEENKTNQTNIKFITFRKDKINVDKLTLKELTSNHIVIINYEYVRSLATKNKLFDQISIDDKQERVVGVNSISEPLMNDTTGENLLFSIKWSRIIIDESHTISNYKTETFRSIMCLAGEYKWCLSGSPMRNWSTDLYAQFKFLGYYDKSFDAREFKKKTDLINYILFMDYEKAGVKLPDTTVINVECPLQAENKLIYNYYLEKMGDAYEEYCVGGKKFSEILPLFIRLRQICVVPNTITISDEEKQSMGKDELAKYNLAQRELDKRSKGLASWVNNKNSSSCYFSPKMLAACKILGELKKGEKIIIFTFFKRVINLFDQLLTKLYNPDIAENDPEFDENMPISLIPLQKQKRKYTIVTGDVTGTNRDECINSFKNSDTDILLISFKVGAESLNLTQASKIIMMETYWNDSTINQAKARINRLGQTKPTTIYNLYVPNAKDIYSIEAAMLEICKEKTKDCNSYINGEADDTDVVSSSTLTKIIEKALENGFRIFSHK